MQYAILNIEIDPRMQGFLQHQFDAALAVNVLHATRNLKLVLNNVRLLLKPGGLLVLSEVTDVSATAISDATWGLTEGQCFCLLCAVTIHFSFVSFVRLVAV